MFHNSNLFYTFNLRKYFFIYFICFQFNIIQTSFIHHKWRAHNEFDPSDEQRTC